MPYFAQLTEEQLRDILKDVGADEQSFKRDVNYLIDWLEQTPYLPSVKDEMFLSSALLRCKNSMERAKKFLDYYYSRRTLGLDMFSCRNPLAEEIRSSKDFMSVVPLPRLTPDGYRIIICSFKPTSRANSSKNLPKMASVMSMLQMQHEVMMKSEMSKAFITISDTKNFGVAEAAMFLTDIKKIYEMSVKTSRARVHETYIINALPAGQRFYNMTKNILSAKMLGRTHMWSKPQEELAKVLPKSVLPSDFGGDERSLAEIRDAWYEHVKQYADWFKSEENFKADLSKRPRDDDISQEIQASGLQGSFRKIDLD